MRALVDVPPRMRVLSLVGALIGLLVGAGCAGAPGRRDFVSLTLPAAPAALVIRNATVFTATGPDRLVGFDVVVMGDRITSVVPTGGPLPEGAHLLDGTGRTLLPGLVDAHVHVTATAAMPGQDVDVTPEQNLEALLYAGVTTVYDLGGMGQTLEALEAQVEDGALAGPRILHTDIAITSRGGHPIPLHKSFAPWPLRLLVDALVPQVESPADAEPAVSAMVAADADFVKIMCDGELPHTAPPPDDETLRALVSAAHARERRVVAHTGSSANARSAVRAGVDVLAHLIHHGPLDEETAREIARARVPVITTLALVERIAALARASLRSSPLDEEMVDPEVLAPFVDARARARIDVAAAASFATDVAKSEPHWRANLATLRSAGVTLIPGTDSGIPGVFHGSALHDELERLVSAGMTPTEVLLGATVRAARLFHDAPEFGTIEAGKAADLLLVEGDPFTDIRATRRIVAVVRDGRVVTRHRQRGATADGG